MGANNSTYNSNSILSQIQKKKHFKECDKTILRQTKYVSFNLYGALLVTQSNKIFYISEDAKITYKVATFCTSIKEVIPSFSTFFILSNDMELFYMDYNRFLPIYTEYKIKQFSCGRYHGSILTTDGKILTFLIGNVKKSSVDPDYSTDKTTWTSVVCGGYFTASIDNNSMLYVWIPPQLDWLGEDIHFIKRTVTTYTARKIPILADVKQVACGRNHVLALTNSGIMYTFGDNRYGQLGLGHEENQNFPYEITAVKQKVIEIASNFYRDLSCCLTVDNKVYVWGDYNWENLSYPFHCKYMTCLQDVFNTLDYETCLTIKISQETDNEVTTSEENAIATTSQHDNDLAEMLFDSEYSNFHIVVHGQSIGTSKLILVERSDHFKTIFNTNPEFKHKETKCIVVINYSYQVYWSYIKFLHFGQLDITSATGPELYSLAHDYNEERLKQLCHDYLNNNLCISNVVGVYQSALLSDNTDLKQLSLSFMQHNFNQLLTVDAFESVMNVVALNQLLKAIHTS